MRPKTKIAIGVKIDIERLERLDKFREALLGKPNRTAVIEQALDEFLNRRAVTAGVVDAPKKRARK
jgi:hypothetical protein